MGTTQRKERERDQRRRDILSSARAAFLKHGIATTTMERIAQEAELAKGTLYLYFRNREELLMGLLADDLRTLTESINVVTESPLSPPEKLERAFTTFHSYSQENVFFYQMMTHTNVGLMVSSVTENPVIAEFVAINEQLIRIVETIVDQGVREGYFHLHGPIRRVVAEIIIAMKGSVMILRNNLIPPGWVNDTEEIILGDIVKLIIRGLQSRGSATDTGKQS
ncbi:MAG: TetR/AcrR family transcriptional regulator [Candidatus Kapabacteria bacterium]|nr:TetR/AcrR family transcriptional regulator [Candidatus Kapabacteria bacterium]